MTAQVRARGFAPIIVRSLIVPATANLPMFVSGKKAGIITWLSVVRTSSEFESKFSSLTVEPSSRLSSPTEPMLLLLKFFRMISPIRACITSPPAPCSRVIVVDFILTSSSTFFSGLSLPAFSRLFPVPSAYFFLTCFRALPQGWLPTGQGFPWNVLRSEEWGLRGSGPGYLIPSFPGQHPRLPQGLSCLLSQVRRS